MLHIIGLLFWLVVIPYCIGLIPANFITVKKRGPGFVMLAGYFVMWALFEVVAIPAVLFVKYDNFKVASNCFMALGILCAAAGVWLAYRNRKACKRGLAAGSARVRAGEATGTFPAGKMSAEPGVLPDEKQKSDKGVGSCKRIMAGIAAQIRQMSWAERIEWLLFAALLGFQLYKAAAYASFDGDDAYYVVESLIAQQADVMYRILPYTGRPTDLDIRHALAVFPMWIAFLAKTSGIHATIVSHTVMPFVLIPLSYLVYYEIGRRLFHVEASGGRTEKTAGKRPAGKQKGDGEVFHRENLPIFMILMAVFQIFGNVSIYTNETFFLTRTWQGKAVAGSLVIPALFWMFLWIFGDGKEAGARRVKAAGSGSARRQVEAAGNGAAVRRTDATDESADRQKAKAAVHRTRKRCDNAGLWLVFVCINMTAGVCSSIAVFLACILMALTALALAVTERDFKVLLKMGAVCIPNVVYMAVYVVTAYSYLLQ